MLTIPLTSMQATALVAALRAAGLDGTADEMRDQVATAGDTIALSRAKATLALAAAQAPRRHATFLGQQNASEAAARIRAALAIAR